MALTQQDIDLIKAELADLSAANQEHNNAQTSLATATDELLRVKDETAKQHAEVLSTIAAEEAAMAANHAKFLSDTESNIADVLGKAESKMNAAQMAVQVASVKVDSELKYIIGKLSGDATVVDPTPAQIVDPPAPVDPIVVDVIPEPTPEPAPVA